MGRGEGKVSRPSTRTLRPICFSCSERTTTSALPSPSRSASLTVLPPTSPGNDWLDESLEKMREEVS